MARPLLLPALVAALAAACVTLTPAQQERNNALTAARSCENGSPQCRR
jgi:hypothetical protein